MTSIRSRAARALVTILAAVLTLPVWASGVLRDLASGESRTLEDYVGQGKWTVVMLWASDCPICGQEAPAWSLFDTRHRDTDATVVGLSLDGSGGAKAARAFVERHLLDFPNLIGEPQDVARLFTERGRGPFLGTPSFLIYSPAGELKARQTGPLPTDRLEEYIRKQTKGGQ